MADAKTFRSGERRIDPATDSALLLQRMGFFTLGVALPITAMMSRRAAVVLTPVGVALLVIAALLSEPERFVRSLRRRSLKLTTLALALLTGWVFLSLSWAPRGALQVDRGFNLLFALALGALAVAALPERMRAANINALAVGAGIATVVAALSQATGYGLGDAEDDVTVLARGLSLVLILLGPLLAWLLSRGRARGAACLFLAAAVCAALARDAALMASLAAGVAAFGGVVASRGRISRPLATLAAVLVLATPLAAFAGPPLLSGFGGALGELATTLGNWRAVIAPQPIKLMTGHGFGAVLTGAAAAAPPLPPSILTTIWHELGLVGAMAFAAALFLAMRVAATLPVVVQAGVICAYVTALGCGVLGLASFRAWWLMTLVTAVILIAAIARGQARTDRPLARFVATQEAAAHRPGSRPGLPLQD
jgi:hypothetical protein